MIHARRTYAYLVSAISLAAVLSAVIWLLRDLLLPGLGSMMTEKALNIAILIISVPVYAGHWFWQQRLAQRDIEERNATGRRIYLYVVMAAMVITMTVQGYDLASRLLRIHAAHSTLYYLIPIAIASIVFALHARLLRAESREEPDTGNAATARRLYIYGFSAAGLTMIALAVVELVRWLLSQLGIWLFDATPLHVVIRPELARLIIGLPLWWIYWRWARQLFDTDIEERESVLRKFYLYAGIFIGTVGTVSTTALLLAEVFRQMLGLRPEGELRDALAMIIGYAAIWLYHSLILREDLRTGEDTEQQAEMRRLYLYLLAAVGLIALIAGLISDISLLITVVNSAMTNIYREQLAYSTAAIVAGLPVWFLAWRQAQQEAGRPDRTGSEARRSGMRKGYIYFFQFVAIVVLLGSAIYVVSALVNWLLLTGRAIDLMDLAWPIAISVVHLLVWLYHWTTLRADRILAASDEVRNLEDMRLVMLQRADDQAIAAVNDRLQKIVPEMQLEPVHTDRDPAGQDAQWLPNILNRLAAAQTIVVPWTMVVPHAEDGEMAQQVAQAIIASPARKVVLPSVAPDWVWIGAEMLTTDKLSENAVETLRQIASGERIRGSRKLGCGAIALIVIGVLVLLGIGSSMYIFRYLL